MPDKIENEKLELLVTITERNKGNQLISLLEKNDVAFQLVVLGNGTANSSILKALGLADIKKDIVMSVIKQNKIKPAFKLIESELNGIAFTIPLTSMVGMSLYSFLKGDK